MKENGKESAHKATLDVTVATAHQTTPIKRFLNHCYLLPVQYLFISAMACPACNPDQNLDYYMGVAQTFDYLLPTSLETFILFNTPPSHDDCTLIKESLLSLTPKFVQLRNIIAEQDEAIAALSLVLDHYKDSHEEMLYEQSRVDDLIGCHRRALSSPIHRVPVDIMQEIFLLVSFNAVDITDFAWIATHTCTEWRDIAKQMPILWSKIHINMDI
ncbi:hypothetical protein EDD18DRAFT_1109710 [Armillaria luteobubalina]|uniref:F-box domain-containing protein n=1 Tax=Armillaria luteobubalina TaxID=153913 RepID=A0AA39PTC1_9AGAR|nr:hypothetical protein EDD18DRAFT_1109710 [Armillaria luteobubalina]